MDFPPNPSRRTVGVAAKNRTHNDAAPTLEPVTLTAATIQLPMAPADATETSRKGIGVTGHGGFYEYLVQYDPNNRSRLIV